MEVISKVSSGDYRLGAVRFPFPLFLMLNARSDSSFFVIGRIRQTSSYGIV